MKILRFFFPIALALSKDKVSLVWNIIIHVAVFLLYFTAVPAVFLISLPLWIVLFFVPIVSILAGIAFVVFVFVILIFGMILPFYCAGGITLGILNYKNILTVLEDKQNIEDDIATVVSEEEEITAY